MLELNKVMLIGNLTRDPELSYLPSGMALAKLGLAVNRRYKDRNGEWKDETAFIDLEAWGKTGEFCSQYLKKGRKVFVEGRLKYDKWEASDGTKRSRLTVSIERIQFADAKPSDQMSGAGDEGAGEGSDYNPPSRPSANRNSNGPAVEPPDMGSTDDDLPF